MGQQKLNDKRAKSIQIGKLKDAVIHYEGIAAEFDDKLFSDDSYTDSSAQLSEN